ncbi:transmembrane protein 267-like [Argonauta hians]
MYFIYNVLLVVTCVIGDYLPQLGHIGAYINTHLVLKAAIDNFTHGLIGFISWAIVVDLDLLANINNTTTTAYTATSSTTTTTITTASTITYSAFNSPLALFLPQHGSVSTRTRIAAQQRNLVACLVCMVIAMAVDVDHFLMARSFSLQAAASLRHRPPFHCTTMIPVAMATCYIVVATFTTTAPLCQWRQWGMSSWQWWCQRTNKGPSSNISSSRASFPLRCWEASLLLGTACLSHHLRDAYRRGLWLWPFGSTAPLPYPVYIMATLLLPSTVKTFFVFLSSSPTSSPSWPWVTDRGGGGGRGRGFGTPIMRV